MKVDDILGFGFKIAYYNPLAGRKHGELPPFLASTKAILNVMNRDNRLFRYSVLAAIEEVNVNANRPHQYNQLLRVYNIEQMTYPVAIDNVPSLRRR